MFFFILLFIFIMLLNISFLTIYEQFLIGLSQNRQGPNINSFLGFLQAVFDGMKLLKKENLLMMKMNFFSFIFCIFMFILSFFIWFFIYYNFYFFNSMINMMLFISMISFSVFLFLLIGLFNKSKYSFLGSMTFSNQSISFEIILFFMIFIFLMMNKNFKMMFKFNFFILLIIFILLIVILTELNRSPFDFSEGESELVSGYNTEMSSLNFVMVFMSEYNMIIFFSLFLSMILNNFMFFILFIFTFLFIRCCFPRYRMDFLMKIFWLIILFFIMMILFFIFIFLF